MTLTSLVPTFLFHVRWRLNDPAEENRPRWTRVHKTTDRDYTFCGLKIPEHPYMIDWDDNAIGPVCDRCKVVNRADRAARRRVGKLLVVNTEGL